MPLKGKIHLISSILGSTIQTKCGRDCRIDEDGQVVHDWKCARQEIIVGVTVTHQKSRITCMNCLRRMNEH